MPNTPQEPNKRVDLVFQGGGIKGVALAGALSVLEERGYQPQNVAGASAGAIIATLLAAGYSAKGIYEIIAAENFSLFMDKGWEDRLPTFISVPLSLWTGQGIYEGDYFLKHMETLLAANGVRTFGDLIHPDYANEPTTSVYRYKVQVIVSDITEQRMLVLPRDAAQLGVSPDDLNVARAVRMSMSFPIFFEPVRFSNPSTTKEHLLIDGGLLSNFPVWIFDSQGIPEWPTFGIRLTNEIVGNPMDAGVPWIDSALKVFGPIGPFLMSLASTALEAHDRTYLASADFVRTITVPTLGVKTLDFSLPREKVEALFQSGCQAAEEFLKAWEAEGFFEGYVKAFRSDKEYSRREQLIAHVKKMAKS